jgi:hypothetical protein
MTIITKIQGSFLFARAEVSTLPSATKRAYMISHSDLSKPAAKSELSRDVGAAKARLISTFVFLHFFRGGLGGVVLRRRVFLGSQSNKSRATSVAGLQELEASALSATYTLVAISFSSGQLSNESASELTRQSEFSWRCADR